MLRAAWPALFGVLMAALGGSPGSAQDALGPSLDVRLVEIRVVVEDAQDQPVADLRRDDFELAVDGVARPVAAFEGPRISAAKPTVARATTASGHWILYIDPTFLEPGDLEQVVEDLQAFVREDLPQGTRGSLVLARARLTLELAPTQDLEALARALEGVRSLAAGNGFVAESRALVAEMARLAGEATDVGARNRDQAARALLSRIRTQSAQLQSEMAAVADRLQRFIVLAAGLPEPVVLVVVTGRLPTRAETVLAETWRNTFGHTSRWAGQDEGDSGALGFGATPVVAGGETLSRLRAAAVAAQTRGIVLHTVDAGALRLASGRLGGARTGFDSVQGSPAGTLSHDEALRQLAEATGGRALLGSRAFRQGLQGAALDDARAYRLGFALADGEGGEHQLSVRLSQGQVSQGQVSQGQGPATREDLSLRYRTHLHFRVADEVERDATLAALMLGGGANPLAVEVEAGAPRRGSRGGQTLPLTLRLPLANLALVAQGREHVGRLSVFSVSGTLATGATPVLKALLPVRVANEDLLTALGRPVEYRFEIPWRQGSDVALGVRDDLAPLTSILRLPLSAYLSEAAAQEP